MEQKHQLLKARECSAEAVAVIADAGGSRLDNLATSFDRWEIKLAQTEACVDAFEPVDELEQGYVSAENETRLRAELAALVKEGRSNGNQ